LAGLTRAVLQHGRERLSANELHREVGTAVRLQAQAVDRHDAGVLELAADLRLLQEALHHLRIVGVPGSQHLERHTAAQVLVAPLEDDADAAARDLAEHLVAAVLFGALLIGADAQDRRVVFRVVVQENAGADSGAALDRREDALVLRAPERLLEDSVPVVIPVIRHRT